ncbi:iron-containing alcohol dehydrogenase [Candidatus Bipolaricaulota bacterium]|nr:iron-containing alcohol dehydrogenase [Candidatus Bipolaricaulota bacterium]
MQNFTFQNRTKIIFGRGTEEQVGVEVKNYSGRALFLYGGGSIKRNGIYDRVMDSLDSSGIEVVELGGVQPNPRLSLVKEGIKVCREDEIDFILAVGGGSVIDTAKAISIGVPYEGDVWDFYSTDMDIEESLPIGTVLTIPAAGSESSPGSVITKEEGGYKRDAVDNELRPEFSILNPEFTYTLPEYQTASGAADIMAHVMERYFTNEEHVGLTDRLCEGTLRTVIENTPVALEEPENYDARAEITWASTIAHNDLLGTGRVEDWASHKIEHELSGMYDVTHGAGLAIVFPAWMEYVYQENVERFAQFTTRVWGKETNYYSLERTARGGIKALKDFFSDIGLPTNLNELDVNIGDGDLEEMANKCTEDGTVGNFVKLDAEDVLEIYRIAR